MASIKTDSAITALNEKDYINKLYDSNTGSQKELLKQNYTDNLGVLNQEQQRTQQQTDQYQNRTAVENQQAKNLYNQGTGQKISTGGNLQAALYQNNTQQRNQTKLNTQQNQAVAEIDRQRQLQGSLYASQIKEAQANNDMQRAQALYEAAKAEDSQFLALRKQAASLMASKGDNSVMNSLAGGNTAAPANPGETWRDVLKNESTVNSIYDNQLEAQRQQLYQDYAEKASDLEAQRLQALYKTDQQLNDAYVDSLQKAKNYQEVQNAYGQGSGLAAQAQIARDAGLQDRMTDLRTLYLNNDAGYGMDNFDLGRGYRDAIADSTADINADRAQALYKAAETEEQRLLDTQQFLGNQYAKQGNYEMLGRLYGLTPDQVDRLMNRGKYAPQTYYSDYSGGYSSHGTPKASGSSLVGLGLSPSQSSPILGATADEIEHHVQNLNVVQTAKQAQAARRK